MGRFIFSFILLSSQIVGAQTQEVKDSFGALPQLMIAATLEDVSPIEGFDLADYPKNECQQEIVETPKEKFLTSRETKPYLTLDNNKFKFEAAFVFSFGSEFQVLEKELENQGSEYKEIGKELKQFIASDFDSFSHREAAMEALCEGKNEKERLALVSHLSKNLSSIYDYQRSGGGPNSGYVVSSEMQWNALNQKSKGVDAASGVCRDATSTVSAFAQKCGFSKDQIRMESIKTAGAGHVVTVIRGSDGKNYNINWSEFFSTDSEPAGSNPILNTTNVNGGVTVSSYDADGNLRATRLTEVGAILKANAGGDVSDLNYLPNFNQMRLAANKVSLNLFQGSTTAGDDVKGLGLVANDLNGMPGMTVGMSLATNERYLVTKNDGSKVFLNQKIILASMDGKLFDDTKVALIKKNGNQLILDPNIDMDINFAYYMNEVTGRSSKTNFEGKIIFGPGGDLAYYNDRSGLTVSVGAKTNYMIGSNATVNERGEAGEKGSISKLPTFTGYQLNGAASFKVSDRTEVGVYTDRHKDYFQKSDTIGFTLKDNDGRHLSHLKVGYTKIEDGLGAYKSSSQLVRFNAYQMRDDGRFRINVDGMAEPNSGEFRIMSGISYRFGKKKK